jgi:probable phosphoglycerate mutase
VQGRRLVLLRHGRTGDNAGGRIQGQRDTALDYLGHSQALLVAPVMAALAPSALLTSDLSRATDTAAPVGALTGLTPRPDDRLRELDLGTWQGLTQAECEAAFPDEFAAWRAGQDVARGGGESYRQAGQRGAEAVREALATLEAGQTLLAVTHGGTARGIMSVLLEQDPAHWWRYAPLGNCHWSLLVEHPLGWRMELHNSSVPTA